jgi:molybdopterin/thiamine biosynthesis adenylyltransferase
MSNAVSVQDITSRNTGLFNLARTKIGIIGAGAIGSFVAESLVRCGCMTITIADGDSVGVENIGVQNYNIDDLGKTKPIALKDKLIKMNPTLIVNACPFNWQPIPDRGLRSDHRTALIQLYNSDILLLAVDNMQTRHDIVSDLYKEKRDYNKEICLIDSRMGAEVFQLYVFKNGWKFGDYAVTWYKDEDADTEPCNARSTSYCANMAAAFIVNQIKKIAQDEVTENEITFSFNGMLLSKTVDHNIEMPKPDTYPNGYYKDNEENKEEFPNFFIGN